MARPRRSQTERADERFRAEIRKQAACCNLRSQKEQAERAGMSQPTFSRKYRNPAELTVRELRGIVEAMGPDPKVLLALLGYTGM